MEGWAAEGSLIASDKGAAFLGRKTAQPLRDCITYSKAGGTMIKLLKRFLNPGVYSLRLTSVVRHVALDNAVTMTVVP